MLEQPFYSPMAVKAPIARGLAVSAGVVASYFMRQGALSRPRGAMLFWLF
jgi:hypothetical protein